MSLLGREYTPSGVFSRLILRENRKMEAVNSLVFVAILWVGFNMVIVTASAVGMVRLLCRSQYSIVVACGLVIGAFILATMSVGLEGCASR